MINRILIFNFKGISPRDISNNALKFNIHKEEKDSFKAENKHLSGYKPSFGGNASLPFLEIEVLCDKLLAGINPAEDSSALSIVYMNFTSQLKKIVPQKNISPEDEDLWATFWHNLTNALFISKTPVLFQSKRVSSTFYPEITNMSEIQFLAFQKEALKNMATYQIKGAINEVKALQKNNYKTLKIETLLNWLHRYSKNLQAEFRFEGRKYINNLRTDKPKDSYYMLTQPILNAKKYGEGKPFRVIIGNTGKNKYYMSFINPETRPIPDDEIDRIIEGKGYRSSGALKSEIHGTGFGFEYIKYTLTKNGYSQDIQGLIQKGRDKGVCVRVPIIGIID